ncbi:MAG TPA: hypothetical protein VGM62_10430 [Chthoniobacterales bacterium]|jgi:hypothetical protein
MKRLLAVVLIPLVWVSFAHASDIKVDAKMAKDKDSKPTTHFDVDTPQVFAFFHTDGSHKGDKLRAVWIADDVGEAALANTKIDETGLTADKDNFFGAFSLSKPTKGWPEGKYHVDIYAGDDLATSVKFTIGKSEDSEESKEDSSND